MKCSLSSGYSQTPNYYPYDFIRKGTESISHDFDNLELKDSGTQVVLSFFPVKLYDSIKILRDIFFLIHKRSVTSEGV